MKKNLRIPMTFESREALVGASGSTSAVWTQWGNSTVPGCYESDLIALEGDIRKQERQAQERRGGVITIRYHADLASRLSGKWRVKFSPMPGMPEENHLVRAFSFLPHGERSRFISLKVEREVK